jgi:hypothetical protein
MMEYFDSADVQNIKVGQDSMAGKQDLILKGLDATKKSKTPAVVARCVFSLYAYGIRSHACALSSLDIDDFLDYFPPAEVDAVRAKLKQENELNVKEYDCWC